MKNIARLVPAICLAMASMVAHADTLAFNNNPTGEIGPYNLTLTTSTTSTPLSLFCMNDQYYIQGGESWGVNVVNGASFAGSLSGSTGFQFVEEAYIYSKFDGSNATDVQDALWTVFDPTTGNVSAGSPGLVSDAFNFANQGAGATSALLSGVNFYIWDGGQITNQWGQSAPQNFVGAAPAPEPSSLILLGSGLVGLAGTVRRKLART